MSINASFSAVDIKLQVHKGKQTKKIDQCV